MLAIQLIEMEWLKENRTPSGAVQREQYYKPIKIEPTVPLSGEGIFLQKRIYHQRGNAVFSVAESSDSFNRKLHEKDHKKAFTGSDEHEYRKAARRTEKIQKEKGFFYDIKHLELPCINIIEETNNTYRIQWFDSGKGMPRRRGGNENLYKAGAKLAGKPNVLNETAFILEEGQAGVLKYNYRYTSYHGQWYKCYYVYIVNEAQLTQDIFIRNYDYEYNQLADLF